jgi:hypothetical protein
MRGKVCIFTSVTSLIVVNAFAIAFDANNSIFSFSASADIDADNLARHFI